MDLQKVRSQINEIDETLDNLFDNRLECSAKVAEVKLQTGDEVYKPAREKEIYSRYSEDSLGQSHRAFVRKIVQQSRKFQYKKFIEADAVDKAFYQWADKSIFEKGGILKLCLVSDETGNEALDIKNILEIASDTNLKLKSVKADTDEEKIEIIFEVADEESIKAEAFLLSYMLYKETM